MEYVALVILIALIEYIVFGILVGRARAKYKCPAPAVSGDPMFERYYRVHMNTSEQMLIFLPAIVIYGVYGNPVIAAAVGLVFPVSRVIYLQAYLSNPAKRGRGFLPGFLAIAFLIGGGLVEVIGSVF